ncbi:ABC transporter ATP-binding protein [Nocardioides endophyticus]|uniref:ABC transporter ATP-binding protein n=1 Tax=Nocardioides endophyticus TaxID=1353775 RepID=A0ABP8ZCY5_9ACTN
MTTVATPADTTIAAPAPILEARGLTAGYGDLAAVRGLDMVVHPGEIVALLGPNGAGKTTTLLTLAGSLKPLAGEVRHNGKVATAPLYRRVRSGMGFIPEERSIISKLSVKENLGLGRGPVSEALRLFPQLQPLLRRPAGLLSGGEQQMLTLARCLASRPSLMLVDELSLGLAPIVVAALLRALREAATETGAAVLLVEQQVQRALSVADRWYLLQHGALAGSGAADENSVAELAAAYL